MVSKISSKRKPPTKTEDYLKKIGEAFWAVDSQIVILLGVREALGKIVYEIKSQIGEPIIRPKVRKMRLDRIEALAEKLGLHDKKRVRGIFATIIKGCEYMQLDLQKKDSTKRKVSRK